MNPEHQAASETEKEIENQNQEPMTVNPNQELISEEGSGSTEKSQEDEKPAKKREYRITVTEVHQMHPYFWGSLKAMVSIEIPGFTIRGIRIVQEENEQEFQIHPPRTIIGREERGVLKIHSREYWARICEEVSQAYLASKEEWERDKSPEEGEEESEALETQASS